jgi:hypothetical protein
MGIRTYEEGQKALAREVVEVFGKVLAHPRHEYSCHVAAHRRAISVVFDGGNLYGDVDAPTYMRAREAAFSGMPRCNCNVGIAIKLLEKLKGLAE